MKEEILRLLREVGGYVSGQELCDRFGVSRTAIWKAISQLKKSGYEIEAVRNKGYHLVDADLDLLNEAELKRYLVNNGLCRDIRFYEKIDSTNNEAKKLADLGCDNGLLIVSDHQTSGKGRRGRSWVSPPGINVYYTLMLKPEFLPDKASMLTLVMALAVAKGIKRVLEDKNCTEKVSIKWPNDVLIGNKKVCGILTEMALERDYIQNIVIGVGINIKKQSFDESISTVAGSIENETGVTINRSKLVGVILDYFEKFYNEFIGQLSLEPLIGEYENFLINRGKEVKVLDPKGEYVGTAVGINSSGELLVRVSGGGIKEVYAGEVSVRGIYGYV